MQVLVSLGAGLTRSMLGFKKKKKFGSPVDEFVSHRNSSIMVNNH